MQGFFSVHFMAEIRLYSQWQIISFYAPGLKGPPGASSNWIVRPFVRPSGCLSMYICTFRPAYKLSQIIKVWVMIQ